MTPAERIRRALRVAPPLFRHGGTSDYFPVTPGEWADALAALDELVLELERERICHAGCGVIANANTAESLARLRIMHPDYMSASMQDCIRAAEREIALIAERDALRAKLAEIAALPAIATVVSDSDQEGWWLTLDYDGLPPVGTELIARPAIEVGK